MCDNFFKYNLVASRTILKVLPDIHDNAFAFPCEVKLLFTDTIQIRQRFIWWVLGNIRMCIPHPSPMNVAFIFLSFRISPRDLFVKDFDELSS